MPRPVPLDDDLADQVWARGEYADELRALILACKERQGLGLVPLLTELVVGSAAAVLGYWPAALRGDCAGWEWRPALGVA